MHQRGKANRRWAQGLVYVTVLCGLMFSYLLGTQTPCRTSSQIQHKPDSSQVDSGIFQEPNSRVSLDPLESKLGIEEKQKQEQRWSHLIEADAFLGRGKNITWSEPEDTECHRMWRTDDGVAKEAVETVNLCELDGKGTCGPHGVCFIGLCLCDAGYVGVNCDTVHEEVMTARSLCCGRMLDAGNYDFTVESCRERLQVAHDTTRIAAKKGVIGTAASSAAECGHVLSRFDACRYWGQDAGLASVPDDRWKLAQLFETTTWEQMSKVKKGGVSEDREDRHVYMFGEYRSLFSQSYERVLEIGCGPFTQSFQLFKNTRAKISKELVLLDPLMKDYVTQVSKCRYKTKMLAQKNFDTLEESADLVLLSVGGEAIVDGAVIPRVKIPLSTAQEHAVVNAPHISKRPQKARSVTLHFNRRKMLQSPSEESSSESKAQIIEESPYTFHAGTYNLVVIINVLEHCMNALEVLQNAHNAVAPGGYLVIHDRFADDLWSIYFTNSSLKNPDESRMHDWELKFNKSVRIAPNLPFWDVGHPLNLMRKPFTHLFRQYDVLHQRHETFIGHTNSVEFYFIGRKKNITSSSLNWFSR